MPWGHFSTAHITSLILVVVIGVLGYFLLRKKSEIVQKYFMIGLSMPGIFAIIYNLIAYGNPIEYLPLHMCSIAAILLPIAVIRKNNIIGNLLLIWGVGSLSALIFNQLAADYLLFSMEWFIFLIPHACEVIVIVYMFLLKHIKLHPKYIISSIVLTIVIYTIIHFCNIGINEICIANNLLDPNGELIQVNFMFSLVPEIPALELMYGLIPYKYWYMYSFGISIAIYLSLIYIPVYLVEKRKTKNCFNKNIQEKL